MLHSAADIVVGVFRCSQMTVETPRLAGSRQGITCCTRDAMAMQCRNHAQVVRSPPMQSGDCGGSRNDGSVCRDTTAQRRNVNE